MKVFVVYSEEFGETNIEGVYHSRRHAKELIEQLKKENKNYIDNMNPESYRVYMAIAIVQ